MEGQYKGVTSIASSVEECPGALVIVLPAESPAPYSPARLGRRGETVAPNLRYLVVNVLGRRITSAADDWWPGIGVGL